MRRIGLVIGLVLAASCAGQTPQHLSGKFTVTKMPIINGTVDTGDEAVVELYYTYNTSQGQLGGICTGELIGPHSVLTAGHCTDTSSGSELDPNGIPVCTNLTAAANVLSNPSDTSCMAVFAMFNNCSSDTNGQCEGDILFNQSASNYGRYILVDQLTNPGYVSANSNNDCQGTGATDNDIGLAHLNASTMHNGSAEPALLKVNTNSFFTNQNLGTLRFVGYGETQAGNNTSTGVKYQVGHTASVCDDYHTYEDGSSVNEPTCQGDSGGPSFMTVNGVEVIVGVTSLGDQNCQQFGIDTRVDPYVSWMNTTITGWGDPQVNTGGTSTSSTSGTTGTSGTTTSSTTGSSGTTGASDCNTCESTALSAGGSCNPQYTTCQNDSKCAALGTCYGNCASGDQTCITNCQNTAGPTAVNEFNAEVDCICYTACNSPCGTACGFGSGAECSSCNSGADCATGICVGSTAPGECSGRVCTSNSDCNTGAGETCLDYGNGVKACFYSAGSCPTATSSTSTTGTTTASTTSSTTTGSTGTTGTSSTTGGSTSTTGTTGASGSTSGGTSSGGNNGGNNGGIGGIGASSGSTGTSGGSSGGCGSVGGGELAFLAMALVPFIRRRR